MTFREFGGDLYTWCKASPFTMHRNSQLRRTLKTVVVINGEAAPP